MAKRAGVVELLLPAVFERPRTNVPRPRAQAGVVEHRAKGRGRRFETGPDDFHVRVPDRRYRRQRSLGVCGELSAHRIQLEPKGTDARPTLPTQRRAERGGGPGSEKRGGAASNESATIHECGCWGRRFSQC